MTRDDAGRGGRTAAFFAVLAAGMVAFWTLATPGPVVLENAVRGPRSAFAAVAWSAATLLPATALAAGFAGLGPARLGVAWAHAGRVLPWTLAAAAVAAVALWTQGNDPQLAAAYPWPSAAWLGDRPGRWLAWSAAYAVYYLAFEAFFRGAVLQGLKDRLGDGGANAAQAMLATVVHVGKPLAEVVAAFPASLLFGWLTLRSRSLLPAVVLHLAIGLAMDVAVVARGGS